MRKTGAGAIPCSLRYFFALRPYRMCCDLPDKAQPSRNLITRMFPLAEEAMKTLENFRTTVMAGLDPIRANLRLAMRNRVRS